MSVFKNLLKSDTPTSGSNSGQLSGQGSHFARGDDQPTTVTGTEPQTVGSSDNSASIAPASQARATAGPEAGGQSHIGTTSASSATPANTDNTAARGASFPSSESASHGTGTATSGTSFPPLGSAKHGSDTATTGTSVPSTGAITDGSGTAAIGQTTTYSSRPLASGDPTSSVIDHESTDPLTYKFPEHGNDSAAGVPAGSAAAAASAAWKSQSQGEQMPGGYPSAGYENPYKADHPLDPRVDGGKLGSQVDSSTGTSAKATGLGSSIGSPETSTPSHALGPTSTASGPDYRHGPSSSGLDTGAYGTAGPSAAALGTGAFAGTAASHDTNTSSAPAPSTLTTTADPTDRSATYSASTATQGLDHALSATGPSSSEPVQQQQSVAGRVLGALGLGGAAGAAATALGYGEKSAVDDAPRDTSAIATQPGQSTLETGPPKHYRRESIPTTAYPGGPSSPRAVAPPVGGTQVSQGDVPTVGSTSTSHAVAPVVGGTQTSQADVPREPGQASFHDLTTTSSGAHAASSEDHTSRNVAAGGVAAAATGIGAYGLHEHNRQETSAPVTSAPITSTLPDRSRDATSSTQVPHTTTGATSRDVDTPIAAVAAAPSRYDGQDAPARTAVSSSNEPLRREEDHTTRNTALGAGAGTAVAGGAAYAAHERSENEKELAKQREHEQKEAARAEKEHQKELEKEHKQHQKELEKEQKHHQKEIEKQEKKHEKEAEKEEKKHQKEAEKAEKEHEATALAAQRREEARLRDEEETRKRHEREAAAGVGAATATGAGVAAHEKYGDQHQPTEEKEKKPNIFKRIFKRRKNKDTGAEEEYSSDDEEDKAARSSHVPAHHSDAKGRNVLGHGTTDRASAEQPRDSVTGLPYDPSKDPAAAGRLSRDPAALEDTTGSRGTDGAPLGVGSATTGTGVAAHDSTYPSSSGTGHVGTGATTGTAGHDPVHPSSSGTGHVGASDTTGHYGTTGTAGTTEAGLEGLPASATEPFGVIDDHRR